MDSFIYLSFPSSRLTSCFLSLGKKKTTIQASTYRLAAVRSVGRSRILEDWDDIRESISKVWSFMFGMLDDEDPTIRTSTAEVIRPFLLLPPSLSLSFF